jgi:hypothetical protein
MSHHARSLHVLLATVLCGSGFSGCSGGGGGGGAAAVGIALPGEISAVSPKSGSSPAHPSAIIRESARQMLETLQRQRASAGAADLPSSSDYQTAAVRKFVEIKVLDIFTVIEQIFKAIGQTNYSDSANVNHSAYKCMVAWEDEGQGGSTQKTMQTWVLTSSITTVNGNRVNRVHAWIQETDGSGDPRLIRAQLDIQRAPTRNSDNTLADLGIWELKAIFDQNGTQFFFADATVLEDGTSRMRMHEQSQNEFNGNPFISSTRGVIYRNESLGYGKVEYPDYGACQGGPGACPNGPPQVAVAFSYNDNYLTVQVGSQPAVSFDRNDEHTIVHRYGIYASGDGRDVQRDKNFGFPVRVDDGRFGWYGAWQDHHQLWVGGTSLSDGTTVTRQDVRPGDPTPSYTTRSFAGALTKINLVPGSLEQVLGIPAEIFLFKNVQLIYDAGLGIWQQCIGDDGMGGCASLSDFSAELSTLEYNGAADQRSIFINQCNFLGCTNLVYLSNPGDFYEATQDPQTGRWTSTGAVYTPNDGDRLWCSIGGRTYIMYTAQFAGPTTTTGWVEKTLTSFDQSTWTPSFDPAGDHEFAFEVDRQYFINNRGTNLRVTRSAQNGDAGDYQVFMEVQRVAKPSGNLSSIYASSTVLVEPWNPDASSTYLLDTDPQSPGYLLLTYNTVSTQDQTAGISVGDVVQKGIWGLRIQGDLSALVDATTYNWQYGQFGSGVTYLLDSNLSYVLLDEPLRFQALKLPRTTDLVNSTPENQWLNFSLMFDGNMHGLPDTWFDLEKVNFTGNDIPQILANNVVVPDGTLLTDANSATYYVRAIDAGIFIGFVTAFPAGPAPDMTLPDTVVLDDDIPIFAAPDLSLTIPDSELKYIEGKPVE